MAPDEIPFCLVSIATMEVSYAALEVAAAMFVRKDRWWSMWIPRLLMVVDGAIVSRPILVLWSGSFGLSLLVFRTRCLSSVLLGAYLMFSISALSTFQLILRWMEALAFAVVVFPCRSTSSST